MAFSVFWTMAIILVLSVIKVSSNPPVPVLDFQDNISEDEETAITCTLPCDDCLDVKLDIKANVTFKSCAVSNGINPNVSCILEVTREMHEMEFTCEAQFKTTSLPKKLNFLKIPPENNRSERRHPVLATISFMLMATIFSMHYAICNM